MVVLLAAYWTVVSRREYKDHGKLSMQSAVAVWLLHGLHACLTGFAAWRALWRLPLPTTISVAVGGTCMLVGVGVLAAGIIAFRSMRRMSGLEANMLVSSGIYHWSRNPQSLGWGLALLGVAILGESGFAVVLVLLFGLVFHIYVVAAEEPYLEQVFGEAYRTYRLSTPRYVGRKRMENPEKVALGGRRAGKPEKGCDIVADLKRKRTPRRPR